MIGQQKVNISEEKPAKYIPHTNGCEVISNDEQMKIELRHITVMDGSMESDFYHTTMWIKEDGGWLMVNNTNSYKTQEEFISAISQVEEFTQAMRDYYNKE